MAGFLWDHVGHSAPFILGVGSAAAGVLAITVLLPREHQPVNT